MHTSKWMPCPKKQRVISYSNWPSLRSEGAKHDLISFGLSAGYQQEDRRKGGEAKHIFVTRFFPTTNHQITNPLKAERRLFAAAWRLLRKTIAQYSLFQRFLSLWDLSASYNRRIALLFVVYYCICWCSFPSVKPSYHMSYVSYHRGKINIKN